MMPIDNVPLPVERIIDFGETGYSVDKTIPLVQLQRKTKRAPVNTNIEKRVEELCFYHLFPYGKGGFNEDRRSKPTALEYHQSRLMGTDLRFWNIPYLFYSLAQVERVRAGQGVGVCEAKITNAWKMSHPPFI